MDRILGQDHALQTLDAALGSERVHHAFIFHGPAGVGKFTAALRLAQILLCPAPMRDEQGQIAACGACESCRMLQHAGPENALSLAHPDLHVVVKELAYLADNQSDVSDEDMDGSPDPEPADKPRSSRKRKLRNIPVEVLTQHFLLPVTRKSQLGGQKVFIIDEAELIEPIGQNKLLKTLEEPPAGTFLVLVTSNEDRLLPTIRSRCQRVTFGPLPVKMVARWLEEQVPDMPPARRQWLAQFSEGSLGWARLALDYDLWEWGQVVLPALDAMTQGHYPVHLGQEIAARLDTFAKRWVDEHERASKDAANRKAAGLMWSLIAHHGRHRLAELARQCPPNDLAGAEARLGPWVEAFEALHGVEQELAGNVNMTLACDHLVSRLYRALSPAHVKIIQGT